MATQITFNPLSKIIRGLDVVCDSAKGTIGPLGRNVYIDDAMQPKISNDGFRIITSTELPDKLENMGVKIVKSSVARTVDEAGDGTTTTAVLLQAIVHESVKRPENPMKVRKSLLEALPKVVKEIDKASKKIDKKDIKKVALISAEDETIADSISEILNKVGKDAVITVEDSVTNTTTYETTNGYEAHVGYMDPVFINEKERARCVMKDVPVFVSEKKISAISDIKPLMDMLAMAKISECVFVVEEIDNAILGQLAMFKRMGMLSSCVIRAVGDVLKDIEAAVGAVRVSDSTGVSFQKVNFEYLGKCEKVVCDAKKTLFIAKDASKSKKYAAILRKEANEEHNQFIRDRINRRASQMTDGVAVLRIGTADFNREYLKDKADDAIKACKSALEEGVVEGGGMCLYRIARNMKAKTIGEEILKKVLSKPLRQIIENAGEDYAEIITNMPEGLGYDAKNNKYVNMVESGIIDPAKVERCSLTNALENAANLITSHAAICEYVEPKV